MIKPNSNSTGWIDEQGNLIGSLHEQVFDFVNNFARFYDRISGPRRGGWVNSKGVQIGKLYVNVYDFENNFAVFKESINGEDTFGWVNEQGKELTDKRYDMVWNFEDHFASFKVYENNHSKYGYINDLGFEFRSNLFKFTHKGYKANYKDNKKLLISMEQKLLKDFPKDSLKRFILEEMYVFTI